MQTASVRACWAITLLAAWAGHAGAIEPKVVDALQPVRLTRPELSGEIVVDDELTSETVATADTKTTIAVNYGRPFEPPTRPAFIPLAARRGGARPAGCATGA